jgi:hypothetical protein
MRRFLLCSSWWKGWKTCNCCAKLGTLAPLSYCAEVKRADAFDYVADDFKRVSIDGAGIEGMGSKYGASHVVILKGWVGIR